MKALLRTISAITLVCFLLTNVSFAQEINSFKLAAPSNFSNLKGPEFKDAAQIQVGIREALKDLESFNVNSIKALGAKEFTEKSVFGKRVQATIYFNEARECQIEGKSVYVEAGNYIFKATTKAGGTYYCLISKNHDGAGYGISVVSKRVLDEALEKGIVKFSHDSMDKRDKDTIDLYLEHEITTDNNTAIDEWVRERMGRGKYAVENITPENEMFYANALNKSYTEGYYGYGLVKYIMGRLKILGVSSDNMGKIEKTLLSKPLVLIPYDNREELPSITIGGQKVKATAHSSPFATYIFVHRNLYSVADKILILDQDPSNVFHMIIHGLVHEVGAMCGLPVAVKNDSAWNILDEYVDKYEDPRVTYVIEIAEPDAATLRDLAPIDLFDLELRNDYAAGDIEGRKKNIFKRVVPYLFIGALGAFISDKVVDKLKQGRDAFVEDKKAGQKSGRKGQANDVMPTESMEELISKLKNEKMTLFVRCNVIRTLVQTFGKNAKQALIDALEDKESSVREEAVSALGIIRDKDAVGPLIKLLKKKEPIPVSTRIAVIQALGELGDGEAFEPLLEMLNNDDEQCFFKASVALGKIDDPRTYEYLVNQLNSPRDIKITRAIFALGELRDRRAIEVINKFTDADDVRIRIAAWQALDKLGVEGAREKYYKYCNLQEIIEQSRHDKRTDMCSYANQTLGEIDDVIATNVLIENLHNESWQDPGRAARSLANKKDPRVVDVLIDALRFPSKKYSKTIPPWDTDDIGFKRSPLPTVVSCESLHSGAAFALGVVGDQRAIQPLRRLMVSIKEDEEAFINAALALFKLGDKEIVSLLTGILKGDDIERCEFAAAALTQIGVEASSVLTVLKESFEKDKRERVREAAKKAIEEIQKAQKGNSMLQPSGVMPGIAGMMATTVMAASIGVDNAQAAPSTIPAAQAAKDAFAQEIFDAIASNAWANKIYYSEASKIVSEDMAHRGKPVVLELIKALRNNAFVVETRKIGTFANFSAEYWISVCAIESLGKIGDAEAVDILTEVLRSRSLAYPENGLRIYAAEALGRIGDKRAVPALINELGAHMITAMAIANIPQRAEETGLISCIITALGEIGDDRQVDILLKILKETLTENADNADMVKKIISALGKIKDKKAVPALSRSLKSKLPDIRDAAAISLALLDQEFAINEVIEILNNRDYGARGDAAGALLVLSGKSAKADGVLKTKFGEKYAQILEAYLLISAKDWEKLIALGDEAIQPLINTSTAAYDSSLIYSLKEYLSKSDKGKMAILASKLNAQNRSLLMLVYLTNQSIPNGETDLGLEFHCKYPAQSEEAVEKLFGSDETISNLPALDQISPEELMKYLKLLNSVWYEGQGQSTMAAIEYEDYITTLRLAELAKRSAVIKLLIQESELGLPEFKVMHFAWSRRAPMNIRIPRVSWSVKDTPRLQKLLKSPYEYYRNAAAKALRSIEAGNIELDNTEYILKNLRSKDFSRESAAKEMLDTKTNLPQRIMPDLLWLLHGSFTEDLAMRSFAKIGQPAMKYLRQALENENDNNRRQTIKETIEKIQKAPKGSSMLQPSGVMPGVAGKVAAAVMAASLGAVEDRGAAASTSNIDSELAKKVEELLSLNGILDNLRVSSDVTDLLAAIGQPAVLPLSKALKSNNPALALFCIRALSVVGGAQAVDAVIEATRNDNAEIRSMAVMALGEMHDKRALPRLVELANDKEGFINILAKKAASEIAKAEDKKDEGKASQDKLNISDDSKIAALINRIEQLEAQRSRRDMDGASTNDKIMELTEKIYRLKGNTFDLLSSFMELARMGKPAVQPLIDLTRSSRFNAHHGIFTLGIIGEKEAVPFLLDLLENGDSDMRFDLIVSLGVIKDRQALGSIKKMLYGTAVSEDQRSLIKDIMEYIEDRDAGSRQKAYIERAIESLGSSYGYRAMFAKEMLIKIGKPSVGPLVDAVEHKGWTIKSGAIGVLSWIGDAAAAKPIAKALKDDKSLIRDDAIDALGHLKNDESVTPLIEALKRCIAGSENSDAESAICHSLGRIGSKHAVKPLLEILVAKGPSDTVKSAIVNALGEIGDDSVMMPLINLFLENQGNSIASRLLSRNILKAIKKISIEQQSGGKEKSIASESIEKSESTPGIPQHIREQMAEIGDAIPEVPIMGLVDAVKGNDSRRVDRITEILWQAAIRALSEAEARKELAQLAPEVGATPEERDRVFAGWIRTAESATLAMSVKRAFGHNPPSDEDIRLIAGKIREAGIEVFVPRSQFPEDATRKYRNVIETIGGKLRVYQSVDYLENMITNPEKSIVMTVNPDFLDAKILENLKASKGALRFMRFAKMEELDDMGPDELDNYQADILGILLVARVITPEDIRDSGNPTYRLLAHLLEDYMPENVTVEDYIQDIVINAVRLIKTILKALPASAYKAMKQSVEVLWSA